MLILAVDTSALATAALVRAHDDGRTEVLESFAATETNAHAEVLAPAIGGILEQAGVAGGQLDRIVVGVGPGPFTGLRVGLATAQALGFAWQVPVDGVVSLDAIAWQVAHRAVEPDGAGIAAPITEDFTVAIDARRREVYWARYSADGRLVDGPHVGAADQVPAGPVVGIGASLYPDALEAAGAHAVPGLDRLQPQAAALGAAAVGLLHAGEALRTPVPLYLREADAKVPQAMKGRTA
ncbi:tRNA (adenosine(37)-N6)-threonylcarbamoyltransferase complex dimerization subunit type 1 TsaB [Zhihengliuella sp.]|uniref:tRNA (adenosine(37)-N6)-threonylcarbamoyltransferase complex dimerization subunit type 1 TsaB n=1 Tax=Zhihengliuella sp. TaxID=1954483 RepID=UPI002810C5FE|nr:tRNA (adenosine(37)-N6)-threonylcarbamoyltransferase complex dimerization subunit type 1 TsaB [Zhihengliuella sp.]